MSDVKRGASSNYNTLSIADLKALPVKDLAEDDSVLFLWCPSSLLQEGLDVMEAWGFRQTQTHIWVKTKQFHLKHLLSSIMNWSKSDDKKASLEELLKSFCLDNVLAFGLGRLFRQTHELVLVGVRGKIYQHLANKSQRSVHFYPATKHSEKPEALQNMIDVMFPSGNKIELFARRIRSGYTCLGNEIPVNGVVGEDIRISLNRLINQ
jgi:N6-adenosine-specific RNA methylase IME4